MSDKELVEAKGLTAVPKSERVYGRGAHEDARLIFNQDAPYIASKLTALMMDKLENPLDAVRMEGAELVAKFQNKLFRSQPEEIVNPFIDNGGIDEATQEEFLRRLGHKSTRMVATDADIVSGSDEDFEYQQESAGENGRTGKVGSVPGDNDTSGRQRIPAPFRSGSDREIGDASQVGGNGGSTGGPTPRGNF